MMKSQSGDAGRDVNLLTLSIFIRRIPMGFLNVVRPIYFTLLGFDPLTVGLITTIGSIISALDSALFGVLSDKYGRKPFLALGSFTSALRFMLYILSGDFWVLVIAQGIGALGEGVGAGQPVVSGYIADKIKDDVKRTRAFSLIAITNAIGSSLGSLLAMLPLYVQKAMGFSEIDSYMPLFWLGLILSLTSLSLIIFIREAQHDTFKDGKLPILQPSNLKEIMVYSMVRCTDGVAMQLVSSLAPLYFYLKFNVGPEDLAPIYAAARILPIPAYVIAPLFAVRFGYVKCLMATRAASGLLAFILPFIGDFNLASLNFIFYNFSIELSMPIRQSFATIIAGESSTGSLVGVSNSLRSFVSSLAPAITGFFFQVAQLYTPFILSSSLFILNMIQFHLIYGERRPVKASQKAVSQ